MPKPLINPPPQTQLEREKTRLTWAASRVAVTTRRWLERTKRSRQLRDESMVACQALQEIDGIISKMKMPGSHARPTPKLAVLAQASAVAVAYRERAAASMAANSSQPNGVLAPCQPNGALAPGQPTRALARARAGNHIKRSSTVDQIQLRWVAQEERAGEESGGGSPEVEQGGSCAKAGGGGVVEGGQLQRAEGEALPPSPPIHARTFTPPQCLSTKGRLGSQVLCPPQACQETRNRWALGSGQRSCARASSGECIPSAAPSARELVDWTQALWSGAAYRAPGEPSPGEPSVSPAGGGPRSHQVDTRGAQPRTRTKGSVAFGSTPEHRALQPVGSAPAQPCKPAHQKELSAEVGCGSSVGSGPANAYGSCGPRPASAPSGFGRCGEPDRKKYLLV